MKKTYALRTRTVPLGRSNRVIESFSYDAKLFDFMAVAKRKKTPNHTGTAKGAV